MNLKLRHSITKGRFDLRVDAEVPATGVTGVFGPSGAGKTTLLRCIAGLDGDDRAVPVHQRRIAYVTQESQLFEHLNVRQNLEYGAKRAGQSTVDVAAVIDLLDLDNLQYRDVVSLSGGESQRVALARAVCCAPRLLLMDEPLSALDEARKESLLSYIDCLCAEFDIPILYVSHNIDEICRLVRHLVVMDAGRVVASGELQNVLTRLDLPQLGGANTGVVIDAARQSYDERFGISTVGFSGGQLALTGRVPGERVRLRIQASDVSIALEKPKATSVLNILPAVVEAIEAETDATVLIRLRVADDWLISRVTRRSVERLSLTTGTEVFAQIKSVTVRRVH